MRPTLSHWKKREQWFLDRIGKKIFRGPIKCQCESCKKGHLDGIWITDKDHALYLHSIEGELGVRYTDKKYDN